MAFGGWGTYTQNFHLRIRFLLAKYSHCGCVEPFCKYWTWEVFHKDADDDQDDSDDCGDGDGNVEGDWC